jgi:hypothetical protein
MYEHHVNASRVQQRQRDYEEQAANERSLRALRRSQNLDAPVPKASYVRRLLAVLAAHVRAGRVRLAHRLRGVA